MPLLLFCIIFMIKKTSSRKNKQIIKFVRLLVTVLIGLLFFYLTENHALEEIRPGEPPLLYSNVCHDNLERVFLEAIQSANKSILLIIYSLSDPKLIQALNQQATKGVVVKVIHDSSTPPLGFRKLSSSIAVEGIKRTGLMHQKILVVDREKIWIGSANMTSESLRVHDNLVVGLINQKLAHAIEWGEPFKSLSVGGQRVEYWDLPQRGKAGLQRLVEVLDGAKSSIRVAMFTWTHSELTAAILRAHHRGIQVEIILDYGQAQGVCQQTLDALIQAGVDVSLSSGVGLLHHKFAWVDEELLVNGSANWTIAAFSRNKDCFLILHSLTPSQNEKMRMLWKKTRVLSHSFLDAAA